MKRKPKTPRTPAPDRILSVASELFYKKGYRATGINEVIDKSDVAKATLYTHFPSKDHLALAYIRASRETELEYLDECIAKEVDPVKRLLTVIESLIPWLERTDFRGCPFINLASEVPDFDSPLRQEGVRVYSEARRRVKALAEGLIASDPQRYAQLDADQLTDDYLLLFAGAVALAEIYHAIWPVERACEAARRLIGE